MASQLKEIISSTLLFYCQSVVWLLRCDGLRGDMLGILLLCWQRVSFSFSEILVEII
jgi:hypothetical protein